MATNTRIAPVAADSTIDLHWGGIIAGAICASALAFVLHAFAGAIGMSLSSTAPTWRDSSSVLVLLPGLYLVLAALASYSFGAYIAARLRAPSTGTPELTEFRDGIDGLLVWALATLLTGLIALAIVQSTARLATTSGTSAETSVAGENIIAYDLDRLLRSDRRPQGVDEPTNYQRAEAARILLTIGAFQPCRLHDDVHDFGRDNGAAYNLLDRKFSLGSGRSADRQSPSKRFHHIGLIVRFGSCPRLRGMWANADLDDYRRKLA